MHGAVSFGLKQADCYVEGLLATFELIAANPLPARLRHEFVPPVRLHPYRSHMIIYVEQDVGILIVRVLHARQDWTRYLRP